MNARDYVSILDAKERAYVSLSAARDNLQIHMPLSDRAMAVEWMELEAMKSPSLPGMPHLDAAILLLLREIAVYMEYLAADLRATAAAARDPGDL